MNKSIVIWLFVAITLMANQKYVIHVEGMYCPLCTAMIRKALLNVEGVVSAKASLRDKNARVEAEDNVKKEQLLKAIKTTGYTGEFVKQQ